MTKECRVILNNDAVTVVKFDNKEIQFPSIHKKVNTVFVKVDNGTYSIVDKMENDSSESESSENKSSVNDFLYQKKSKKFKKTTGFVNDNSDEDEKSDEEDKF